MDSASWGNGCKPLQSEFEYALNLRKSNPLALHVRHSNCSARAAGHRVSRFGTEEIQDNSYVKSSRGEAE
jgi:hypothetical protein